MERKTQIHRLFNKKAGASVGKAIKILTSVVLGAAMIAGTYGIVKLNVIPKTENKISSMFEVTGDILAEAGGVIPTVDKFSDGPCSYFYYDTLQNAVADASAHTTENANADESTGKAFIAVRQSDDVYIVKPTEDQTISSSISMSNKMIFDANGKQIELVAGAELNPTENSDITFRDSGNGRIYKDVDSSDIEALIYTHYSSSSTSTITMLNGNYEVKNTGHAFCIYSDGVFNSEGGTFSVYSESGFSLIIGTASSETSQAVNINGGKFEAVSKHSGSRVMQLYGSANITEGEFNATSESNLAQCVFAAGESTAKISGGTFNATAKTLSVCVYTTGKGSAKISGGTFDSEGFGTVACAVNVAANSCIEITGGYFEASTSEGFVHAVRDVSKIENATMKAYATNDSGTHQACVYGVSFSSITPTAEISNTNIEADYNVSNISVNDNFTCEGIRSNPGITLSINNCHVKAVREGLSLRGSNLSINGGTYEGVQHGGAYFACEKAVVKDATFRKWDYDGKYNKDNIYSYNASFYIGNPDNEVRVFMDNCRVENANNSVLSSNYSNKNTYLYASNTAFNNIRIDGTNSNGDKGHMFVGKGCTYNSTSGSGDLDTTTYSSVEFTPEYVQNNFS